MIPEEIVNHFINMPIRKAHQMLKLVGKMKGRKKPIPVSSWAGDAAIVFKHFKGLSAPERRKQLSELEKIYKQWLEEEYGYSLFHSNRGVEIQRIDAPDYRDGPKLDSDKEAWCQFAEDLHHGRPHARRIARLMLEEIDPRERDFPDATYEEES